MRSSKPGLVAALAVLGCCAAASVSAAPAAQQSNAALIVADPSPLSRLLANGEDLVTNVNHLIANANRMFSNENIDRVSNTLAGLEQTVGAISDQRGEIRQTLTQLAEVSRQASSISCSLRFTTRSGVRNRPLASCWVRVEAPCTMRPARQLIQAARTTPWASIGPC